MKKLRLLGNVCACALLVVDLVLSNSANAGTVGMPGQWSFIGQAITYDPSGLVVDDISLDGNFDFDTGTVYIKDDSPFFGLVWQSNGTLSNQLDGTYAADLTASGNFSYDWEILWEIAQTGTTALVLTVDRMQMAFLAQQCIKAHFPVLHTRSMGRSQQLYPSPLQHGYSDLACLG